MREQPEEVHNVHKYAQKIAVTLEEPAMHIAGSSFGKAFTGRTLL